jgi:hypothetical protein
MFLKERWKGVMKGGGGYSKRTDPSGEEDFTFLTPQHGVVLLLI